MTADTRLLQQELLDLPGQERLKLAHWLLGTVVETLEITAESHNNPLLAFAGMFAGGPGNTAERAEEILETEVNLESGT
jgi:hypothetical protein